MSTRAKWIKLLAILLAVFSITAPLSGDDQRPAKTPVGVPSDAVYFKGKWYRVYVQKGGWKRAQDRCVVLGGRLAVVRNEALQAFIKELASELPLWLGASDEKTEGLWQWIDGTHVAYTAWEPGQPNNGPRENFLMIGRSGLWHDAFEAEPGVMGFICEWDRK